MPRIRAALALSTALLSPLFSAASVAGIRLPKDGVPVEEEVRLDLDPAKPDYTGTIVARIDVPKATATIHLHAKGPVVERATLRGAKGAPVPLAASIEDGEILVLRSETPIAPGKYTLEMSFHNAYNTKADSLYRVVADEVPYLFTQFEDTSARQAFPCWDEPAFKIPWKLTLTVPSKLTALANSPIESESASGSSRTVVFKKTPPMPSYLVALAVGPLETVPVPGTSIPTRIVTVRGKSRLTAEVVRQTPPILASLERYFGKKYPYEKLDLIAVPDYWYGAMENPGAIVFRDSVLLLDPASTDASSRRRLASVTAHELAHMWFGDLVTMAWWDDTWLNESFASWMGDKVVQEVYPDFAVAVSQVGSMQDALSIDGRSTTHAMRQSVESQDVLLEAADGLAYDKGQSVLDMFEGWIGKDTFRKGVIAYLDAHAWGNATGADLWNALSKAAGKDVSSAMSSFLDQPGVPIVSAELLGEGKLRLTQRRFFRDGKGDSKQVWKIPVTIAFESSGKRETKTVLLDKPAVVVTLGVASPKWVHPNADERGYYRWSLPPGPLAMLSTGTVSRLTARERMGMVGNLGALFESGALSADEYLAALARFGYDPDPEVLTAVVGALDALEEPFGDETVRPALATFVRKALRPAWERIGPVPRAGEPDGVALVRPKIFDTLGMLGEDAEVLADARDVTARYLADPASVSAVRAFWSIRVAARYGDAALWETFRKRFETAKLPAERTAFLTALGLFRDHAVAKRALAYALEGPLRPNETFDIARQMAGDPDLEELSYAFTKAHYAEIGKRIPVWGLAVLPRAADGCSAERAADAKRFFLDPAREVPGASRAVDRMIERVDSCVRLRQRSGADVLAFLTRASAPPPDPTMAPH